MYDLTLAQAEASSLMLEGSLSFIYQIHIYLRTKTSVCPLPMELIKIYKLKLELQNIIKYIFLNAVVRGKSARGLFVTAESMMNTWNVPLLETLLIVFSHDEIGLKQFRCPLKSCENRKQNILVQENMMLTVV